MLMLDAKGSIITPAIARQMMAQIALKFGLFIDNLDLWAEMHPSQASEWENCAIQVQYVGKIDMAKSTGMPQRTFLGIPLELNVHLSPTVVLIRKRREIVAEIGRLGLTNFGAEMIA